MQIITICVDTFDEAGAALGDVSVSSVERPVVVEDEGSPGR
jgi:hypothetical protein